MNECSARLAINWSKIPRVRIGRAWILGCAMQKESRKRIVDRLVLCWLVKPMLKMMMMRIGVGFLFSDGSLLIADLPILE